MQVQIKEFTGPLDLLLQLIRREEMDIFDIDIHKITHQYLHFIETHPLPDLQSAGEFIKLAATLIYIKSRSLFPPEATEEEQTEEQKLKNTLVQSLLRHQNIQQTSQKLNQLPLTGRDTWTRHSIRPNATRFLPADDTPQTPDESPVDTPLPNTETPSSTESIKPVPLLKLLKSYHHITHTRHNTWREVKPLTSLSDHISHLSPYLCAGEGVKMSSMIGTKHNPQNILLTFLSLLELCRLSRVSLFQEKDFSDIMVVVLKPLPTKGFFIALYKRAGKNQPPAGCKRQNGKQRIIRAKI